MKVALLLIAVTLATVTLAYQPVSPPQPPTLHDVFNNLELYDGAAGLTLSDTPQYNNVNTRLTLGTTPNGLRINTQGPTLNPQKTENDIQ